MTKYVVQLMDCERVLLNEIADKRMKRNDIAMTYAMSLTSDEQINWAKINQAIIDRWSRAALIYIKERAWKLAEGHR